MRTESKWMQFEPKAGALAAGDSSEWITLNAEYPGRIVAISGSVIDESAFASGAQNLEKFYDVEIKISRESKTGGGPVRFSTIIGVQGNARAVSYPVDKGDVVEVQFTNLASGGNALLPSLTMELAAQVPGTDVPS